MIAPSVVQEVKRLLAGGNLSQRKIAGMTGISRGTVGAIAGGKRPGYDSLPRAVKHDPAQPTGPPQRCPGCGGMVYMPCRLCKMRALKAKTSKPPIPPWPVQLDVPLGLELREADRARYEEVRAQKVNAATSETGCRGDAIEHGDLCGAFEPEDDPWEMDPADFWDAFEPDDDEPAADDASVSGVGVMSDE
jgi:hypothetical protein